MEAFGQLREQSHCPESRYCVGDSLRGICGRRSSISRAERDRSRKSVEWIIAAVESQSGRARPKPPYGELAEFMVDRSGFGLLESRTLRERLALYPEALLSPPLQGLSALPEGYFAT